MNEPLFTQCPSFDRCSCNRCPLDARMLSMDALPGEETCKALRRTRLALAVGHILPTGGLTEAEIASDRRKAAAKARWAALSPEERAAREAKLQPFKKKVSR